MHGHFHPAPLAPMQKLPHKLTHAATTVSSPVKGPRVRVKRGERKLWPQFAKEKPEGCFPPCLIGSEAEREGKKVFPDSSTYFPSSAWLKCTCLWFILTNAMPGSVPVKTPSLSSIYAGEKKYSSSSLQIRVCSQRKGGNEEGSDSCS